MTTDRDALRELAKAMSAAMEDRFQGNSGDLESLSWDEIADVILAHPAILAALDRSDPAVGLDVGPGKPFIWSCPECGTEVTTIIREPAGLREAWDDVESVLPKTWYISNLRRRSPNGRYSASATLGYSTTGESMSGFGPTPEDALRALAKRFREPPFAAAATGCICFDPPTVVAGCPVHSQLAATPTASPTAGGLDDE